MRCGARSSSTPARSSYRLNDETATLVIRPARLASRRAAPRGRRRADQRFALRLRARRLQQRARAARRAGPGRTSTSRSSSRTDEARLWAQAFALAEEELGLPHGSIKCTVLIETILAAYEMDAILYELRDHSCALNAGRWDYIFSCIKKTGAVLPDRGAGDDDGAVHARVHAAAREDVPRPRARMRSAAWPPSFRRVGTPR